MLPPAPARCHSAGLWPIRAGLKRLPPSPSAEYQRLAAEEERSPSFCSSPRVHLRLCPAAPSHSAELLNHSPALRCREGKSWLCVCSAGAAVCVWLQPSRGLICSLMAPRVEISFWQRATMKPPGCCPCPNPYTSTTPSSPSSM